MEFSTKVGRPETVKTDAIVVGVHADGELTPTAKMLDAASGGAIKAAVKSGDMTGKRGTTLLLRGLSGFRAYPPSGGHARSRTLYAGYIRRRRESEEPLKHSSE